jgi:hypothetical protein
MLVELRCTGNDLSDDISQLFCPTGGGIDSLQTAGVTYKPNMLIHRGCNVDTGAKMAVPSSANNGQDCSSLCQSYME